MRTHLYEMRALREMHKYIYNTYIGAPAKRSAGALGGQSAAAAVDAASSGESRAPKRPRANASAQSSVWHTPEALKRRREIASLLGRAYVATDSLYAVIVSLLAPC